MHTMLLAPIAVSLPHSARQLHTTGIVVIFTARRNASAVYAVFVCLRPPRQAVIVSNRLDG